MSAATNSSSIAVFENSSSCSRCFDIKESAPLLLACIFAFFCVACVLAHILVYCRERRERAKRRQIQQRSNGDGSSSADSDSESEPDYAFSFASFGYCMLLAVGFSLLVLAAWQNQYEEEANNIIVIVGLVLVLLGMLMCGWFLRHEVLPQPLSKQDEEIPTDEESLEDVEKGTGSECDSIATELKIVKVVLQTTDTEAESSMTATETVVTPSSITVGLGFNNSETKRESSIMTATETTVAPSDCEASSGIDISETTRGLL